MPEQSAGGDCGPLSLLEKAARVMNAFSSTEARLTLTEVVERSGVPRSSAHRILEQLQGLRWLEREGRGYRLGMGVLELGALASHHHRLRRAALPHLHELHETTGHLVHLAVLDEAEVVHVERIGGAADTAVPSRVGGRQPAYCTASGKAILAFSDDAVVEQVVRRGLRPRTPRTICRPEALRAELATARSRGVAYDHEEAYRGCRAWPCRCAVRAGRSPRSRSPATAPTGNWTGSPRPSRTARERCGDRCSGRVGAPSGRAARSGAAPGAGHVARGDDQHPGLDAGQRVDVRARPRGARNGGNARRGGGHRARRPAAPTGQL
ncbi:IclR family transcriptional regulator [Streptomyces albulus]|nr:IclR family transcriptional regulator [Streptomyces noursei]